MIKIIIIYAQLIIVIVLIGYSKDSTIELKNLYSGLIPKNKINFGYEFSFNNIRQKNINDIINQHNIDNYQYNSEISNNDIYNIIREKKEVKNIEEEEDNKF